jgi:hydrogenase expression/formation protein HypE
MSKFSLEVLQRCVFPYTDFADSDVILGAAFGEDVSLTRVGGDVLVSHVDPIVGAIGNIGWLAVHVACNDVATSGVPPRWVLLLVLVPSPDDEDLLGDIMSDASRAAKELGISIIGGHTGYSAGLSRPLVAVTAMGTSPDLQVVRTAGAELGDRVLVTKGVALEGTAILAEDFADVARRLGLSEEDLREAKKLMSEVSIVPEALALASGGASAIHDVTRGGLLETLLEMARLSDLRIEIDAGLVPERSVVTRFATAFRFDPLRMISSGTLVATVPPGKSRYVEQLLEDLGTPFGFVGDVSEGSGVRVIDRGEPTDYTEIRCEDDELARMWAVYPRD